MGIYKAITLDSVSNRFPVLSVGPELPNSNSCTENISASPPRQFSVILEYYIFFILLIEVKRIIRLIEITKLMYVNQLLFLNDL